jgi:hypothetical protein
MDTSSSDINLTSPAATLAVGLVYPPTERQELADVAMQCSR